MCGIAGFLSEKYHEEDLRAMTDRLSHRGPDAGGYFFDENADIGLGHRRLSIIDLSTAANQPFYSQNGRYVIVFNGEIYNYRDIQAAMPDVQFRTTSDTEVIVEAFAKWGTSCVHRFNGMFAFAIWDFQEHELYLYRDRLGVKPLYYYWNGQDFLFASELKSLKMACKDLEVNRQAISHYLYLGYAPASETFYERTFKLPAGSYACVEKGKVGIFPYWTPESRIEANVIKDPIEAKARLKELLFSSVKYRMISDVPLGTFLSGGIDSSTVTAIAQQLSPQPVKTFSIGFKEAKFNESEHARKIAQALGTEHHEFMLSHREAIDLFPSLIDMHDQPFVDSSTIPTLLVSQMARKHVTVALAGDGGDELFLGYGMYNWAGRLSNPFMQAFRGMIASILRRGNSRYKRAAQVFDYQKDERIKSHIFSQEQYLFSEPEISSLLLPEYRLPIAFDEHFEALARPLSSIESQSLFDIKHYLKDDLLVKVDIASMQHALEVRVPLLDYRVVEFALNLSQDLRIRNGTPKWLLKQVLFDLLPKELFDRPKWGFSIPLVNWLQHELRYLLEEYLSEKRVKEAGFVNYKAVEDLKKRFFKGEEYLYNRLWALMLLHQWESKK